MIYYLLSIIKNTIINKINKDSGVHKASWTRVSASSVHEVFTDRTHANKHFHTLGLHGPTTKYSIRENFRLRLLIDLYILECVPKRDSAVLRDACT